MTAADYLESLHRKIPITKALGVDVVKFGADLTILKVPLAPNRNHVDTVFGGSLYSVAALACYGLFRAISEEGGLMTDNLVIRNGQISYDAAVTGDFEVHAARPDENEVRRFFELLKKKGKARLRLTSVIKQDGIDKAFFEGTYVQVGWN